MYYACITVGQTAKKNRILMAIVVYYLYYIATQIISTALTVIFTVVAATGVLDGIVVWIVNHFAAALHIGLVIVLIISLALAVAFWFVIRTIMNKKLNLE